MIVMALFWLLTLRGTIVTVWGEEGDVEYRKLCVLFSRRCLIPKAVVVHAEELTQRRVPWGCPMLQAACGSRLANGPRPSQPPVDPGLRARLPEKDLWQRPTTTLTEPSPESIQETYNCCLWFLILCYSSFVDIHLYCVYFFCVLCIHFDFI